MSIELHLQSIGAPLPSTQRGYGVQVDIHKDGDTIAYGNKNFVITRSLTPGGPAKVYTEHRAAVKVARFNNSGYYVASGDERGNVRVWSYTHPQNTLKKQTQPLGEIADLSWDGEGKRIAACGNGTEKAAAFSWDTGSALGTMAGLPNKCPSLAFKPNRPYRIAVGSEKGIIGFYKGPPFKIQAVKEEHKNFVNCVRYAKDGSKFVSCSTDKKIHIWDGKTGEHLQALKSGKKSRHVASVYGVAFNDDATQIFTASSDKTCKLWDAETGKVIVTIKASGAEKPQVRNQQLGCAFSKHGPLSIALTGDITVYDPDNAEAPIKSIIVGHQEPLSAIAYDSETDTLITGCRGGLVCAWKDGIARRMSGIDARDSTKIHTAGVKGLSVAKGSIFSVGGDGILNITDIESAAVHGGESIGSSGVQAASCLSKPGVFVVVNTSKKVFLVVDGKVTKTAETSALPLAVAVKDDGSEIIVSTDDSKVHFYSADLELTKTLSFERKVCAAAFSHDGGSYVLASSGSHAITLFNGADDKAVVRGYWSHAGSVTTLAFSPDGKYLASGGMDGIVSLWDPSDKTFRLNTTAHYQGVFGLVFTKTGLATIGADNCLKTWKIGPPAEPAVGM